MAKKKSDVSKQGYFDFNIVKKFEQSNATVNELRTGIWAPIDKISANSITYKKFVENKRKREITTPWGTVTIHQNILTQIHKDLVDCIISQANNVVEVDEGMAFYFRRSDVMKKYKGKESKSINDYRWLHDKLIELQTTAIEGKTKDGNSYSFNILSKVAFSENADSYGIVFSKDYQQYVEGQITVNYIQDLDKLLNVRNALIKAIIRFFWTHTTAHNTSLSALLAILGYPVDSPRAVKAARAEIKSNSAMLEEIFGIVYNENEKLLYKKDAVPNQIRFIPGKDSSVNPQIK